MPYIQEVYVYRMGKIALYTIAELNLIISANLRMLVQKSHMSGKSGPTDSLASLNISTFFLRPSSPSLGPYAHGILAPTNPNS